MVLLESTSINNLKEIDILSKKENVNEIIVEYEELEVGKPYVITLTSGAVLSGILSSKREDLSNGSVTREYEILFDSATHVYLHECQIVNMREIKVDDTEEYFRKFQRMYSIKCFTKKGELLPASKILRNLIYTDNTWSKLTKTKRKELIQHMYFSNEDIWDMIEAFLVQKLNNDKLQYERLEALGNELNLKKLI